jgi:inner membrane protein
MTGKTHALIGCAIGLFYMANMQADMLTTCAGGLLGGVVALTPDIDHRNSTISHKVGLLGLPFRLFGHRTITHTVWIPLIMGAVLAIYPHWALIVALGGYVSHILADMVTKRGVPLLYPLSGRSFGLPLIRTGGIGEWVIAMMVSLSIVVMFWEMVK